VLRYIFAGGSAAAALLFSASPAFAQDPAPQPPQDEVTDVGDLIIFGRAEQRIGKAAAASEGALAGADLTVRPFLRTAELLELVPGLMITQHSGSGKANQYFLRGFNLDHGTDFGLTIDGVPMNFRTHGHGPGYLDINGLIPEVVSRVDYRKGPYRADVGDFNLVGGAQVSTRSSFDENFVLAEGGDFDWKRLVAGGSFEANGATYMGVVQLKTYDGPWELPEQLRHLSTYSKYSRETALGTLSASLSTYDADWRPTEQIAERAIGTLLKDRFGVLDKDMTGNTEREIVALNLDGEVWRSSLYFQHYDWSMSSNPTYFLDDPINGDAFEQSEKLNTWGGRIERPVKASDALSFLVGGEFRYDDISRVGLHKLKKGVRIGTKGEFAVDETSGGLFAEATWKPMERLTIMAGLRGDYYSFESNALDAAAWSGEADAGILLPKVAISYRIADGIAAYANWGQGFHANDARAVTSPDDPVPGIVRGEGREVGLRYERHGLVATASYWQMQNNSELIFVGDSNTVEPAGASERHGVELTFFWRPTNRIAIDGVWTDSHARFVDSPGAAYVPGAIKNTAELGFSYIAPKWNTGIRARYLGSHPLIEDNSQQSHPLTVINIRAAWTPGRYELYGELLNVLDEEGDDIEYLYQSYLPQIDLNGPVEGIHSRANEPRMIRAGLKVSF